MDPYKLFTLFIIIFIIIIIYSFYSQSSPIAILAKAELLAEKLKSCDGSSNENEKFLYHYKRMGWTVHGGKLVRFANNDWEIKLGDRYTKSED